MQPTDYIMELKAYESEIETKPKQPDNYVEWQHGKIFGIGLSRTGTTSLHEALKILDKNCFHFPQHLMNFVNYDAAVDSSTAFCFKFLDVYFPNAKFIYTMRDIDGWVKSMLTYYEKVVNPQSNPFNDKVNNILYGKTKFFKEDIDSFKAGYEKHHFDVMSYFKDRKDDLLVLDIIGGDGWEKLCPFLNCEIPDEAFPKTNPTKDIDKVAESLKLNQPQILDGELIINEIS